MTTHKLFVYGTLLTQLGNWRRYLSPQVGVEDVLKGAVLYHLGGFPGMIKAEDENLVVHGELFEITPEQLTCIDRLEGYRESNPSSSFYVRELVTLDSGEEAFTYFYNAKEYELKGSHIIESGDWLEANK